MCSAAINGAGSVVAGGRRRSRFSGDGAGRWRNRDDLVVFGVDELYDELDVLGEVVSVGEFDGAVGMEEIVGGMEIRGPDARAAKVEPVSAVLKQNLHLSDGRNSSLSGIR